MKDKIFGVLQRVGRSFMLPIAILPVAGLFLGIGGSFTNANMIEAYGLSGILGEGTFLYAILSVLNKCGDIVFGNLPILFAMGVAIGMAKKEKEVAALAAAIAFFIMHSAIGAMLTVTNAAQSLPNGSISSVVGIESLQMGVFGGIIVGLGVAALHNRFYKIELPQVLSFFGGTRFVPIICSIVYLIVGIIMFYIWPVIQQGIYAVGDVVRSSGYAGTLIYGIMERALIPFGLHHVFYLPFWQTAVGGTATIDGNLIEGAQNIFFAQLASANTTIFDVEATRFMAGKFPLMIFGLPGAALAMYKTAKPEKKQIAGGLLLSAALTSMLTGITEPLEFTFLFIAPILYAIHCFFAGCAYMFMHIFKVGVGMTFSGGLIDLTLFGIMQGNTKTNWIWVVLVGIVYFIVYFLVFCFILTIQHHTSLQMKPKLLKIAKKTLPALALILVWDILLIIGVISLAIEYIPGTGAKILFGALEFISFFSLLILIGFSMYIDQTNQALVELKKQQEEFQKSEQLYYEMLLEKEQNTRKYRHDMQNHLICLNGLAKDGDLDALQSYLKNMSDTFQSLQAGYYETGNKILNIIENKKDKCMCGIL